MPESVQYLIAQHVPAPLRQEAHNVGIVVQHGRLTECRFIGEDAAGKMDGRRLRSFRFADVYRQWVEHWRDSLNLSSDIEDLIEDNTSNYRLVRGGVVVDVGADPIEGVLDHLFRLLVKDDREVGRVKDSESGDAVPSFKKEIVHVFSKRGLLSSAVPEAGLFAHHSIIENQEISGTSHAVYRPQFSQENGTLYLMESFDLRVSPAGLERRAGLAAYMYRDIRHSRTGVEPISLIMGLRESRERPATKNSLYMLEAESKIVDWSSPRDRKGFLAERERVATM